MIHLISNFDTRWNVVEKKEPNFEKAFNIKRFV